MLRGEEEQRVREIRQIVVTSVDNVPVRVDDLVEGGPLGPGQPVGDEGVVVGNQTRLGRVMVSQPKTDAQGNDRCDEQGRRQWDDDDDAIQAIVLLRKGEESLPALQDVAALTKELNESAGRMLPGVKIDVLYDRRSLIHVTTDTVQENLAGGNGPGDGGAVDVSQQRADRADRGDQRAAGFAVRLLRCCSCGGSRPTCSRSARSTSASSSIRR